MSFSKGSGEVKVPEVSVPLLRRFSVLSHPRWDDLLICPLLFFFTLLYLEPQPEAGYRFEQFVLQSITNFPG